MSFARSGWMLLVVAHAGACVDTSGGSIERHEAALEDSDFNCQPDGNCTVCRHKDNVAPGSSCTTEGATHTDYTQRTCEDVCTSQVCNGPDEEVDYTSVNVSTTTNYKCAYTPAIGSGSGSGGGSTLTWISAPGSTCSATGEEVCVDDAPVDCRMGSGSGATGTFKIHPRSVDAVEDCNDLACCFF